MSGSKLARAYLEKARVRLRVLDLLMEQEAFSDVVREAQEVVELATKAMLRQVGIEPPKFHDVGPYLEEYRDRFPPEVRKQVPEVARISRWLRKEREFSFYGDVDLIPTEAYGAVDAEKAIRDANFVVRVCGELFADQV